jgi:hypothetical protein
MRRPWVIEAGLLCSIVSAASAGQAAPGGVLENEFGDLPLAAFTGPQLAIRDGVILANPALVEPRPPKPVVAANVVQAIAKA